MAMQVPATTATAFRNFSGNSARPRKCCTAWATSSVVRALPSHGRGPRFKSLVAHHFLFTLRIQFYHQSLDDGKRPRDRCVQKVLGFRCRDRLLGQRDWASRNCGRESSAISVAPIEMSDYQRHWKRYKFWRNLALFALAGFFPVILLARVVARIFNIPILFIIIAFAWFLVIGTAATETSYWRCPRCRKPFSITSWYRMGVHAQRCVHCGLPKYSNG